MKGMGSPSSTQTACFGLSHQQPKGSASFPSIKKCLQIRTTPLFFFSGHICFQISVWDIIVVLCCTKCGDSRLKSPQSCKRRFFRDCLLEQLSKPLRPPTALCRCGFPCYITESIWPFGCPTSKHRVSSVEISALFSYSQVESVETTKKKKNIFIVPKILLFPDLLFVHCVTFRETKKCGTVVCFGRLRLEFLNFSFHFCYVRWVLRTSKVAGQQGDWWMNQR